MHNGTPDTAHVLILPPFLYGAVFVIGLLLHLAFPLHILPTTLARGIGVVCVGCDRAIPTAEGCKSERIRFLARGFLWWNAGSVQQPSFLASGAPLWFILHRQRSC